MLRVYPGVAEELAGKPDVHGQRGSVQRSRHHAELHTSTSDFSNNVGRQRLGPGVQRNKRFSGRSAHSAGSPWAGRSALDAVERITSAGTTGGNTWRPQQRSHYIITHGGDQPNVVPPVATVWYYFRLSHYERIRELHELENKDRAGCDDDDRHHGPANGLLGAAWPGHFNKPLAEALHANIARVGMPEWSDDGSGARARRAGGASPEIQSSDGLPAEGGLNSSNPPVEFRRRRFDDIAEVSLEPANDRPPVSPATFRA